MKKIGIDLDNTVVDYINGVAPLIKEIYGLEPDFTREAFSIEEVFGITRENRPKDMRRKLYIEHRAFRDLKPLEEDNHRLTWYLYNLFRPNCKIYFVTARDAHPVIMEDTRKWVEENTSHFDDIFHTDRKAEFCVDAGISVMVEDEVRQIVPLVENGIDVIVMDQPWNRHLPADPHSLGDDKGRIARVRNWKEVLSAAKEFL